VSVRYDSALDHRPFRVTVSACLAAIGATADNTVRAFHRVVTITVVRKLRALTCMFAPAFVAKAPDILVIKSASEQIQFSDIDFFALVGGIPYPPEKTASHCACSRNERQAQSDPQQ
jgi:hypothetical protein